MVSGTTLFFGLFNNLAIFIVLIAVYGLLNNYFFTSAKLTRQTVVGISFGLFAIGCMFAKIPVADGVILDQRNTIVTLSGAFGGPLSAVISAIMTGGYRMYLGGAGVLAGVVGVSLAGIAGTIFYVLRPRIDSVWKASFSALAATIIILPGFLFVGDLQGGWSLLKTVVLPYGAAVFLGILFLGLLLNNEETRHLSKIEQKKSEKRYRELFENLIDVSYRTDSEDRLILVSPSFENMFGYRPEEVIGRQIRSFHRHPTRREDFLTLIRQQGRIENFESEIRRKDGSYIWVSTNARLRTGEDGSFIGIEGITRDISQLKTAEEERSHLEEHLRQSQKMEAIGTLAGGIAHDFNNILSPLLGYTQILKMDLATDHPFQAKADAMLEAVYRARDLVQQILAFSRKSGSEMRPVNMQAIVKETLKLLRSSIPKTIDIIQEIILIAVWSLPTRPSSTRSL